VLGHEVICLEIHACRLSDAGIMITGIESRWQLRPFRGLRFQRPRWPRHRDRRRLRPVDSDGDSDPALAPGPGPSESDSFAQAITALTQRASDPFSSRLGS
jgi:hypothetical protein